LPPDPLYLPCLRPLSSSLWPVHWRAWAIMPHYREPISDCEIRTRLPNGCGLRVVQCCRRRQPDGGTSPGGLSHGVLGRSPCCDAACRRQCRLLIAGIISFLAVPFAFGTAAKQARGDEIGATLPPRPEKFSALLQYPTMRKNMVASLALLAPQTYWWPSSLSWEKTKVCPLSS
jgi:hypothetical protein